MGEVTGNIGSALEGTDLSGRAVLDSLIEVAKNNPEAAKKIQTALVDADGNYDIDKFTNFVTKALNYADGKGVDGKIEGVLTNAEAKQAIAGLYATGMVDKGVLNAAKEITDKFPNLAVKIDVLSEMLKSTATKMDGIDGTKPDGVLSPAEITVALDAVRVTQK